MSWSSRHATFAAAACTFSGAALGQDLYDTTVLRTIAIQFHDANWLTLLRNNYASQTNIRADLTVNGVTYPSVGVRIRGNTSYTALPSGSEKFSLNVDADHFIPDQEIMGYKGLNLNNSFRDPTFCREVMYNNYVAQFIPNGRANHVVVTLNGQNWGVYANVQQFDRVMLSPHFSDASGLRIKCANNPNGPGLRYNGATASGYTGYEIKDDGGLANPWQPLIDACNLLTNEPLATMWNTDVKFAIDPAIWSVVLENLITDDDSYINKGADFVLYRDPADGRMYLMQTDANETFTQSTWAINRNFTQTTKPVLNRMLAVAEIRQRYMAHYRTAKTNFNWAYFGPIATAHRNLIDAAVQADPKKLYTYANFTQNFTSTVTLAGGGLAGGTIVGLQQFVNDRLTFLNSNAELNASGPTISSVTASDSQPSINDPVTITAVVAPNGSAVLKVELFYRRNMTAPYQRVLMNNVGPNTYSVVIPGTATLGQRVAYYVAATASNTNQSLSFFPSRTEYNPLSIEYDYGSTGGMRITEWMYTGPSGEFIEFTNLSASPINMTGWSFDDDLSPASGAFDLSGFGTVMPGESVVLTQNTAEAFRAAWGLSPSVKIVGNLGVTSGDNIDRNDDINLYDSARVRVDRLAYGDQAFPGTIRTQNISGQTCPDSIGQNDPSLWVRSAIGDIFGSFAATTGEIGTPGSYNTNACNPCVADVDDGSGTGHPDGGVTIDDLLYYLLLFDSGSIDADVDDGTSTGTRDGGVTIDDLLYFLFRFDSGC